MDIPDVEAERRRAAASAGEGWEPHVNVGFSELVGPVVKRVKDGALQVALTVEPKHLNRIGVVHGGVLMTLADQAMSMAAHRATADRPHASVQISVQLISAARRGDFLVANSRVTQCTRSLVFVEAEIVAGTQVVATASSVIKMRGAG